MKKSFFFAILAILAVTALTFVATSCDRKINPVHDTTPVDTTFWSGTSDRDTRFPLDEFHRLGELNDTVGQRALVNQYRKHLTANVIAHYPTIVNEGSIHFVLGSGFATDVQSGDGKTYSGRFQNELIIIIDDPTVKDTVFLACGNGMLSPLDFSDIHDFGHAERWRFTILPGEGLAHHLPELEAWAKVAGELNIPIKDKTGKVVSQETYLNYLGRYESVLFPYDVIDVLNGKVYNQAGQEVNFERRLAETEKANAKAKAKTTKKRRR